MLAKTTVVAVGALIIAGAVIECLDHSTQKTAGCLRACGLHNQKTLTKRDQARLSPSCNQCLRRRRENRRRRSLGDCPRGADESSPAPEKQLASNVTVKCGQYYNTDNWYADVSWSPIDDSSGVLKGYSVRYSFDSEVLCAKVPKNQTSLRINLSRYGYNQEEPIHLLVLSYPTNKNGIGMIKFCNDRASPPPSSFPPPSQTITPVVVPTKSSPAAKVSTDGKESTAENESTARKITNGSDITMKYVSSSVGAIAGVLAVVLAVVCHRRYIRICVQRCKSEYGRPSGDPGPENRDVFIIFNGGDVEWVDEKILPLVEEQLGLSCRIHYRDFKPGGIIYDMMSDSVYESYKNVVVYSRNFLNSHFCKFELNQAKHRLLRNKDDSLVIIRKDDVDLGSLPKDLRTRSVIDYGSDRERPHWERKLCKFLKTPDKNRHESTRSNDTVVSALDVDPVIEVFL